MNQPFFSLQSVAVELGLFGIGLIIIILFRFYRESARYIRHAKPGDSVFNYMALPFSFIFFGILLSDNWLEYPGFALQMAVFFMLASSERRLQRRGSV